jgi:DNA-binding XRE family transcriptional regulator
MIDLNESGASMPAFLGQTVLNIKAKVSHDCTAGLGQNRLMAKEASLYKQQFIARVKLARAARGLNQREMAEVLQMAQDTYKQYETRTMLPHHLIPRFCTICAIDTNWLFTGHGRGPRPTISLAASRQRKPATL